MTANRLSAGRNAKPVALQSSFATSVLKPLGAFNPVPTAVPPKGSAAKGVRLSSIQEWQSLS